jgi:hypothetical protein
VWEEGRMGGWWKDGRKEAKERREAKRKKEKKDGCID